MAKSVSVSGWRMRWLAVAYLALVLAAATYAFLASTVFYAPEVSTSFAPLWLAVVTFPGSAVLSFVFMVTVPDSVEPVTLSTTLFAAGMLQAYLVFRLCRKADEQTH